MLAKLLILLRAFDRAFDGTVVFYDVFYLVLLLLLAWVQVRLIFVSSEHLLRINLLAIRGIHNTMVDVVFRVWANVRLKRFFRRHLGFLILFNICFGTIE